MTRGRRSQVAMIAAVALFILANAVAGYWPASLFVAVLAYFGLYLGLPRDKTES